MSAQMDALPEAAQVRFEPMQPDRLEAVLQVEQRAYAQPWSRTHFEDALHSGYQAQMLVAPLDSMQPDETNIPGPGLATETAGLVVLGYFVAMQGVDEVHLLNITVAPEFQGQGWARVLLDALDIWARGQAAQWLWLEVRVNNLRALRVYEAHGFRRMGLRKAYYPTPHGPREDAIVMSLKL